MKKVLAVLLSLTMVAAAFAQEITLTAADKAAAAKVKIAVSLPTQREARWVSDKNVMESVAKELGIKNFTILAADADTAQQATQVETLLAKNPDVLILAPNDAAAAAALVKKAGKNVKVIAYDRLILNVPYALYVSFDNVKVGELQGEWLTKQVPSGNYIIMSGAPTDNNAKLFKDGAMKYIKPLIDSGKIKVVAEQGVENWVPANALTIVENALTKSGNKVDAILAPNDGTAGGAIQALAAQHLDGKVPVTGQDAEVAAAKRILAGTQGMTVYKDTRVTARQCIYAAIKLYQGADVSKFANMNIDNGTAKPIPYLAVPATVVTKDNLDKMLIDSGYLKRDDVYSK
jgi:D-xylose transport system substrate-binding protein